MDKGIGKVYEGIRDEEGPVVLIDGLILQPGPSQKLYNHSPDGFEWGYGGSGPAQLALAILYDFTGDRDLALKNYQDFKQCFIANARREGFQINASEVEEFLNTQKEGARR